MNDRRDFDARLERGTVLLDGGLGSLLISMGLSSGRAPESWNLEQPHLVVEAHRRYVDAGSDVIHTNSFGATPIKLASAGLEDRCREINLAAARLAREAAGENVLVAGDVGPTGKFFPPMGNLNRERLLDAFRAQVEALLEGGADLISIETMYDRREAEAAVSAALELSAQVMVSMTFESKNRGYFTIVGDRLVETVAALGDSGVKAVGFNCSVTADVMLDMVRQARQATSIPIVAQPNAGQPVLTGNEVTYDADPQRFREQIMAIVKAGAGIVGGCCGTDPGFISEVRRALDETREQTDASSAKGGN